MRSRHRVPSPVAWNGSRSRASAVSRRSGSRRTRPGRRCSQGSPASPRSRSSMRARCPSRWQGRSRASIPWPWPAPRKRAAWIATSCSRSRPRSRPPTTQPSTVEDPTRAGVLFGTAIGGFHTMMEQHDILRDRGWDRVAPWFLPQCLPDVASGAIAIQLGLRGHNLAPISACSTGAHAVMEAAELIRRGDADVVFAGGGEACIHPLIIAGFTTMKGLGAPRPGEGPETASRPFDATRDGFVCAEGATVLVLESVEHAERRGARIHAEVVSGGNTNDAYHAVTPRPDSLGVVTMMRLALGEGRDRPVGDRLHQSARHVDAAGRRGRDEGHQGSLRRPRAQARDLVDEVGDRPPVRRRRLVRGRRLRARAARPDRAADAQLPRPRPRMRPRLRARGRARARAGVRALELDGPRRPQRLRRAAPLPRLKHAALAYIGVRPQ